MNTEQTEILQRRAARFMAPSPTSHACASSGLLAVSDRSATELGTALVIPSNLLAHHLKVLDSPVAAPKVMRAAPTSPSAATAVAPGLVREQTQVSASRIVFVCTA